MKSIKKVAGLIKLNKYQSFDYAVVKDGRMVFVDHERDGTLETKYILQTELEDGVYRIDMLKKGIAVKVERNTNELFNLVFEERKLVCSFDKNLTSQIVRALNFVSNDLLRPMMAGVHVSDKHIVSTDANKLLFVEHELDIKDEFTMTAKAVKAMKAFKDSEFDLYSNDNKLFVLHSDEVTISFHALDGKYLNYRVVIPTNEYKAKLSVSELKQALEDMLPFANKNTLKIVCTFTKDKLTIFAEDLDNDLINEVSISCKSELETKIGFNCKYLLSYVNTLDKKSDVLIDLNESSSRAIIINKEFLLMPFIL
jgi:DNA polymerase III sliding clamp (beta) subunit (PCNA family)